jgi:hypothetical protein
MKKKAAYLISFILVISLLLPAGIVIAAQISDDPQAVATVRVKVAHFAPFADSLDGTSVTVKVDGADALTDFKFGDITDYLDFEPGSYLIEIVPTGSTSAAISGTVTLTSGTDYTLSAIGDGTKQPLELFALVDENMASMSEAKLRIAHLAPFASNIDDTKVDICTDDGSVVAGLTDIPYKGYTDPYLNLPAGDYDLKIAAPGGTCDTTLLDLPSIRLAAGDIVDVFAIGDITNQPLGIASGTGFTATPPAKVKVAHFAPFADSLDGTSVTVKVDGADALADFKFGDITDYLDFEPGSYLIEIVPTGSTSAAISGTVTLTSGTDYTLSAIGDGTKQPLELFALVDDNMASMSDAKLRIAHLAPFASNIDDTKVDICTDDGSVVAGLTDILYKGYTDPYLNLPAGDYDLKIAAPGGTCDTTLLDLPSIRLAAGDIVDVFAIGDITNQPLGIASGTGFTATPPAKVKVAHFAPFADSLDGTSVTVKVDGADALTDFKFGDITDYLDFEPGSYLIEIVPTGSTSAAISGTVTLTSGTDYTLSAIGDGTKQPLELFALVDDNMASMSEAKLRIAHLAPFASNIDDTKVDICTDDGSVVAGLTDIPYKGYTDPYLNLPAGDYDLKIAAAGSSCATTLIDIPRIKLENQLVASVFAVGDVTNFAPSVITDPDITVTYYILFPYISR